MGFGKKMGSVKAVKQSLKGGGGHLMSYIPKEGDSLTVRFLDEPEEWVNYTDVYDPVLKRGYPLPDDPTMPGYDDDLRKSSRYIANAVNVDTDKVIVLQMPKSVVNKLITRYDKNGTLTDRDYEIWRTGTGLETEYDTQSDAPSKKKLDKYERKDLIDTLEQAYDAVFGDHDDDDDDDSEEVKPKSRSKKAKKKEEAAEDFVGYSLEDLEGMKVKQLRDIYEELDGEDDPKSMKAPELIDEIIDLQEDAL